MIPAEILLKEEEIFTKIIGQNKVKKQIKSALIAQRSIILVGPPGIGKTTIAKSIANLLPSKNFVRVQEIGRASCRERV